MQKVTKYKCPSCKKVFTTLNGWINHVETMHPSDIPNGYTPTQYFYFLQTGKAGGSCVQCKRATDWNESTMKYSRFCRDPRCKEEYREIFKNRMRNMYDGKIHLLNDPEQQRKMMHARKISGDYKFKDSGSVEYVGSYEKDFLKMIDLFLRFPSSDIIGPSPHTYYYDYVNENDAENQGRKFYIPDFFIPSLNLEVEIKQNTNMHPKILAVDKVKETDKDNMMRKLTDVNYIKVSEKDYSDFFEYLLALKEDENAKPAFESSTIEPTGNGEWSEQDIAFVQNMNSVLSSFKYGWLHNGIPTTSFEFFGRDYRTMNPDKFFSNRCGVCWDFMLYQKETLRKRGITSENYYIELNGPLSPTHTFTIIPYMKKFIYIESSFGRTIGIWEAETRDDIFSYVIKNMLLESPASKKYQIYLINPGFRRYGLSTLEFMDTVADSGKRVRNYVYNANATLKPFVPDTVATEGAVFDFFRTLFLGPDDINEVKIAWEEKIFAGSNLIGGPPTTSKYITLKKILIDTKKDLISIQNINIRLLLFRMKEVYGEKRLDLIFDRTYYAPHISKFNKKKLSRSNMRITSLTTPLFFALELSIIFKELYAEYRDPTYAHIAKELYTETWLKEADTKSAPEVSTANLKNLSYTLQDHQLAFIKAFDQLKARLNLRGYLLGFEQGLGKTLTAIALAECKNAEKVYIVCPNTTKYDVWYKEIVSYYKKDVSDQIVICDKGIPPNAKNARFYITNNEAIGLMSKYIDRSAKSILIVDEVHNFRNKDGARVIELVDFQKDVNPDDILLLSGTPTKAVPNEIVPALLLLDPLFTEHAAKIYNTCFKFDNTMAMSIVQQRFGRVIYRKTKEILDLPPKNIVDMPMAIKNAEKFNMSNIRSEVTKLFNEIYGERLKENAVLRDEFISLVYKYSKATEAATNRYLNWIIKTVNTERSMSLHELDRQMVDNFITDFIRPNIKDPAVLARVKWLETNFIRMEQSSMGKAVGAIYPPYRAELFIALYEENKDVVLNMILTNTRKTVIFSQIRPVVEYIYNDLIKEGIGAVKVVGGMTNRSDSIDAFKNDDNIEVLVATSQTLGTGQTFVGANQMFFYGKPWRATDFDQCSDRIHRIGQRSEVNIYSIILASDEYNLSNRMDTIMNWSADMFSTSMKIEDISGETSS